MVSRRIRARAVVAAALCLGVSGVGVAAPSGAASVPANVRATAQGDPSGTASGTERLDRGLVAAVTGDGVFLSWRLLADEVTGYNDSGLTGATFKVYRDGKKIATVSDSTNYLDAEGDPDARVQGRRHEHGWPTDVSDTVTPWSEGYLDIPLQKPADGVTPAGEAYTYRANDISPGGPRRRRRLRVRRQVGPVTTPRTSPRSATPAPIFLDAYTQEGELLWRIDLGVNIRAGRALHPVPGLRLRRRRHLRGHAQDRARHQVDLVRRRAAEVSATSDLPRDDVRDGVTHEDDYRLSAAGYYDHLVSMFQGWRPASRGRQRATGPPPSRPRSAPTRSSTSPIRCPTRTRRRSPTTSSTSTRRPGRPATSCGTSPVSS